MDDEKIRDIFKDDNLSDTVSQCFNSIQEQSTLATERMMLSDIIDIYKGVYKDYEEYYKAVVEYNQVCREHNTPKFEDGKFNYTMTFMIEKNIFLKRQFDFIRALALALIVDKR